MIRFGAGYHYYHLHRTELACQQYSALHLADWSGAGPKELNDLFVGRITIIKIHKMLCKQIVSLQHKICKNMEKMNSVENNRVIF